MKLLQCEMCVSTPEQKHLMKMLLKLVRVIIYRETSPGPTWTERPLRKKTWLQDQQKKTDYSFTDRPELLETCPGLMKLKLNCLSIMTSLHLEEKEGSFPDWEQHPNCEVRGWQHHAVGVGLLDFTKYMSSWGKNIMEKYWSNISRHQPGS